MIDERQLITIQDRQQMQVHFAEIQQAAEETQAETDYDLGLNSFLEDCLTIAGKTTTVGCLTRFVRDAVYKMVAPYEYSLGLEIFISGENPLKKVVHEMGFQIPSEANLIEGLTQITIGGLIQKRPFVEALVNNPDHIKLVKQSLSQSITPGTYPSIF